MVRAVMQAVLVLLESHAREVLKVRGMPMSLVVYNLNFRLECPRVLQNVHRHPEQGASAGVRVVVHGE